MTIKQCENSTTETKITFPVHRSQQIYVQIANIRYTTRWYPYLYHHQEQQQQPFWILFGQRSFPTPSMVTVYWLLLCLTNKPLCQNSLSINLLLSTGYQSSNLLLHLQLFFHATYPVTSIFIAEKYRNLTIWIML